MIVAVDEAKLKLKHDLLFYCAGCNDIISMRIFSFPRVLHLNYDYAKRRNFVICPICHLKAYQV